MCIGYDPFYWYERDLDKECEEYMKELEKESKENDTQTDKDSE